MKWYTEITYVDHQTGETLNKYEVEENYIIIKKTKTHETRKQYGNTNKNRNREEYGITKITAQCTRAGKQLKAW